LDALDRKPLFTGKDDVLAVGLIVSANTALAVPVQILERGEAKFQQLVAETVKIEGAVMTYWLWAP
jgi:hypothetical protein